MPCDSWTAESFFFILRACHQIYQSKFERFQKSKTNFNLVANDYNSDDNSDNEPKTRVEKPLFASLSSSNSIDPSTVKIYSLKTDLPGNVKTSTCTTIPDETEENVVEKPTITKSKPNTFASIITGGRNSPSDKDNELIEMMKLEVREAESPPTNDPAPIDKPTEIDAKSFKRKRRIEFMTRPIAPPVKSATDSTSEDSNTLVTTTTESEIDGTKTSEESSAKPMYSNFVRANVDVSGAANQNTNSNDKLSDGAVNEELNKHKTEISELRAIIESKLKFLCNGRPDVSAVQAIFIQFEVSVIILYSLVG